MAKLFNRAKMTTSTTGSGTVTLDSASVGYQSFADAGVSNGDVVQYVIEEGGNFEIGTGTYSATGTLLTRSPTESSNSNAAISLGGAATVSITAVADDLNRLQHEGSTKVEPSATGATVTGNLAVTGTVDGRDVAADGTKLDGIESGATADQTAAEIRSLVESATDSNVFTDADHTKLNGIESGATADQTASEILTAIKTVDGSGSGLDADTLDGSHASAFLTGNQTITLSGDASGSGTTSITVTVADDSHNHIISNVDGLQTALDGKSSTSHNHTLDSLSNTTITSNTSGEILKWNGSAWVNNTLSEAGIQPSGSYLTGNQTITLSGDATGSGTTSISVSLAANSVAANEIAANAVGASELNVTGNGTTSQFLRSDGDGTFTWATPTDTNTTYSAGSGLSLSGTTFSNSAPDQTVTLTGSGATSVSGTYPNFTISSTDTDTNTTYSAGTGMSLSGTTFSIGQAVGTGNSPTFANMYLGDYLYHSGDTDTRLQFGTNTITLTTGGSSEVTVNTTGVRLGDTGNGYFQPVSGNYGSIQADGGAHGGWEGYSIGGRAVFMHDNSTGTGIYNDVDNEWLIRFTHNGVTDFYANGSNEARLETDGDFHADGNVIAYSTTISDPRLKENIQPVTNGLEKVMKLNGYTFDYKADGVSSAGVMSPEVKEVLPSAIKKSKLTLKLGDDNETEYDIVQYDQLTALFIEAIKELKAEIDELKAKLGDK